MSRDEGTYGRVRDKYDEWVELRANKPAPERGLPPQRPYTPEPEGGSDMSKMLFTAIGVGLGVLLLALAAYSFYTAATWAGYARNGAFVGYTVTGFFLTLAGLGGILATLNHNFRVLAQRGGAQGPAH